VAIDKNVERTAVEIGNLGKVKRDFDDVLLKQGIYIGLQYNRILQPVDFTDNIDNAEFFNFPPADIHTLPPRVNDKNNVLTNII
jgi:hypothetical protein